MNRLALLFVLATISCKSGDKPAQQTVPIGPLVMDVPIGIEVQREKVGFDGENVGLVLDAQGGYLSLYAGNDSTFPSRALPPDAVTEKRDSGGAHRETIVFPVVSGKCSGEGRVQFPGAPPVLGQWESDQPATCALAQRILASINAR